MKKRLIFSLYYFVFWIVFFQVARIIFISYQFENFLEMDLATFLKTLIYGLKMDLSFAGYLSVIPFLLLMLSIQFPKKSSIVLKVYMYLILTFMSFLFVLDLELFRVWGYKIDVSVLKYIDSPSEMIASSLASPIFLLIVIFLFQLILFSILYHKKIHKEIEGITKESGWKILVFLVLIVFLFIPIRGGFGLSPMNQSSVCFSNNNFANQAAINYAWNFIDTIIEQDDENPYIFMDDSKAENISRALYKDQDSNIQILKQTKPNIVLIIWESFTYKVLTKTGVTPEFNSLRKEGIFFDNFYANGDRSDKGLVAILSGYPTVPGKSIITKLSKSSKLSHLSNVLGQGGYNSGFFYGGEIEFFRLKSYLSNGNYSFIVDKKDFSKDELNSKWGAHDHLVYNKLEDKIKQAKEPFFYSIFTLSSHEPYEIPIEPIIDQKDEESKFLNSIYYADKSLGNFISNMKKSAFWDNTLFIIVADHGHRLPKNTKYYSSEKFHIPMLWLGSALNVTDTTISRFGNQTDIAKTLLSQLNMNSEDFNWSRNLFTDDAKDFAYYSFNNGFGFLKDSITIVYDAQSSNYIEEKGQQLDSIKTQGRAILQSTYQDFYNK